MTHGLSGSAGKSMMLDYIKKSGKKKFSLKFKFLWHTRFYEGLAQENTLQSFILDDKLFIISIRMIKSRPRKFMLIKSRAERLL